MTNKWLSILNADDSGNRLICQTPEQSYSMAQLRKKIIWLQSAILKKDYRKWVLYDEDGFQFICALFALLTSGRMVMLPASRNKTAIEPLLEIGVGLIGSHSDFSKHFDIMIPEGKESGGSDINVCVVSGEEWGWVDFYTSGSSGRPKSITKSADQLYLEVENFNLKWQPTPNTLFVPLVTHLHIYGLTFAFLLPLFARAGFYLPRTQGLLGVIEPITVDDRHTIDQVVVVTSPSVGRQTEQIRTLAEPGSITRDDRPAPISRVFCAGGKLTNVDAQRIIGLFSCPVTEIFGSTETGAVAAREHRRNADRVNPWQLLPGLDATVIKNTAHGNKIDIKSNPNSTGEFLVWGGHVGGSREEPVMTGDKVKFTAPRQFELLGRSNQVCKIEGKRVSLQHLVEILENCKLVTEAAVLPVKKTNRELLLCGVVLSRQGESSYRKLGKSATDQLIRKHLLQFLNPVLVPRAIRYLNQMPRNEMGKLPQQTLIDSLVSPVFATLPMIEDVTTGRDKLVFLLVIPMELRFLRGHFESRPIVPGFVLLHWVYHFTGEHWNLSLNPAKVNRLKFSKPVAPGEKLMLICSRIKNGVEFLYQNEQKIKFASGQIPLTEKMTDV